MSQVTKVLYDTLGLRVVTNGMSSFYLTFNSKSIKMMCNSFYGPMTAVRLSWSAMSTKSTQFGSCARSPPDFASPATEHHFTASQVAVTDLPMLIKMAQANALPTRRQKVPPFPFQSLYHHPDLKARVPP